MISGDIKQFIWDEHLAMLDVMFICKTLIYFKKHSPHQITYQTGPIQGGRGTLKERKTKIELQNGLGTDLQRTIEQLGTGNEIILT